MNKINLIAKLMSKENIPDSDSRKTHTLMPVPSHCTVGFRRNEDGPEMLFLSEDTLLPSSIIPLRDYGNVYILGDGKTISTFSPDPYPVGFKGQVQGELVETNISQGIEVSDGRGNKMAMGAEGIQLTTPSLTSATAKCETIDVTATSVYAETLCQLNKYASSQVYPMATEWNSIIAYQAAVGPTGFEVDLVLSAPSDESTVHRYFNRVKDVLLGMKNMVGISVVKRSDVTYGVRFLPPLQVNAFALTQTNKQYLLDLPMQGLVINNIQRAVRLLNFGAYTVVMQPQLVITPEERDAITDLFSKMFNYRPKFRHEGQYLDAISFEYIKQD
ncbi:hypothetical protein pEaSNUABM37_00218 [Erwinia phage pEa_SNUABM_37]|nr:hypothetical protein pEaSNUABM37_00218 [Erwinia phage pEa_SNUABM_37]QXO10688.1 hypothetical protein pEaSNUABM48_00218 [Erwinia phage pEa_SNUABM_48]